MKAPLNLIDALAKTRVYQQYESAFSEATGLPLTLRPIEFWQMPHRGKTGESRFCAMLSTKSRACAYCLRVQQKLSENATDRPCTSVCAAGLTDSAVPVRLGERLIGFLQTGQVFQHPPNDASFNRTAKILSGWGLDEGWQELRDAYFANRVMPARQYDSMISLLHVFAEHLSILGNQMVVQQENEEPRLIQKAKEYILEHQHEHVSLGQVAKAVNVSPFYFCKLFKKITGLNYVDYISRLRVEKAKNLLLNPDLRVAEIAFEVGFQSLTHFNRVFKRVVGQPPMSYRRKLAAAIR
jgi:AraC-like DNA-binding protein/ligand-binding sensor protein